MTGRTIEGSGVGVYGMETEYALQFHAADPAQTIERAELVRLLEDEVCRPRRTLVASSGEAPRRATEDEAVTIREGWFLDCGARFYFDGKPVEWATPEATSARESALYDLAGEWSLIDATRAVALPVEGRITLYKNNIDYRGPSSFGCHENYQILLPQSGAGRIWRKLHDDLIPFLVTRQIFCGAGRLGSSIGEPTPFQISQRIDHIVEEKSTDSREKRGLIDQRDQRLAGDGSRRLHLIVGDSNRSPFASYLKMATTGLVIRAAVSGGLPQMRISDPVGTAQRVSRDLTLQKALVGGETAITVQRQIAGQVEAVLGGELSDSDRQALDDWYWVLDDLGGGDWTPAADRVDWAIKLVHLLEPFRVGAGVGWSDLLGGGGVGTEVDYQLRELDLRYHDIDPESSAYASLCRSGKVLAFFDEQEVIRAQTTPPATRAMVRSEVISWLLDNGLGDDCAMDWDHVYVGNWKLVLPDPLDADASNCLEQLTATSPSSQPVPPGPTPVIAQGPGSRGRDRPLIRIISEEPLDKPQRGSSGRPRRWLDLRRWRG